MTTQLLALRRDRLARGHCPRCDRPVMSFPFNPLDACGSPQRGECGRQWSAIMACERLLALLTADVVIVHETEPTSV